MTIAQMTIWENEEITLHHVMIIIMCSVIRGKKSISIIIIIKWQQKNREELVK